MNSSINRLVIRKYVNISAAGTYEFQVTAPEGYRAVSGFFAVAENEDANYADVDMLGSYPFVDGDSVNVATAHGVHNAWRFQAKVNASTALWVGVIAERSDEPDVRLELAGEYV